MNAKQLADLMWLVTQRSRGPLRQDDNNPMLVLDADGDRFCRVESGNEEDAAFLVAAWALVPELLAKQAGV